MIKNDLDKLIKKYKVQPVGTGYIDCILTFENIFDFINDLSNINIIVYGLTWWCHCKDQNADCPHGMGGPKSEYYDGWFSEMWFPLLEFKCNEQVIEYIKNVSNDKKILKCFVPALWLDVPDNWKNELERIDKQFLRIYMPHYLKGLFHNIKNKQR